MTRYICDMCGYKSDKWPIYCKSNKTFCGKCYSNLMETSMVAQASGALVAGVFMLAMTAGKDLFSFSSIAYIFSSIATGALVTILLDNAFMESEINNAGD